MTTIQPSASADERARWRSAVGLDCPAPAANPRRIRYNGTAQLSWQHQSSLPRLSVVQS